MDESPFRIAIFGDLRGDARDAAPALAQRPPVAVDRDNFDEILARFAPRLRVPLAEGGPQVEIAFNDIDDFHPDSLYDRLDVFAKLRSLRKRLEDPETFNEASAELGSSARPAGRPQAPPKRDVPTEGLLDSILGEQDDSLQSAGLRQGDDLQDFINRAMASSLAPKIDPKQPEYVAEVDNAAAGLMRRLLHHPRYQALESLWRGVYLLTRRIETGVKLKLFLFDASLDELAADLLENEDLRRSALYKRLVEEAVATPGADPWGLLIGAYRFGSADDLKLLAMLGGMARAADAPWVAEAAPGLAGADSLAGRPDATDWRREPDELFATLRKFPEAEHVGLIAGRYLAREPYGRDSDPCERFAFEEMAGDVSPERFLWGPPALVAAQLLSAAFSRLGWDMQPVVRDLNRLPLFAYKQDGESRLQPAGEALLTERAIERIHDRGLMALSALKDSDTVRLVRFQSIADPPKPLAGRWG